MQINPYHVLLVDEIDMINNKKPYRIFAKDQIGHYCIVTKYMKTHRYFISTAFNDDPKSTKEIVEWKISKTWDDAEWCHLEFIVRYMNQREFIQHCIHDHEVN